jgi:hypothetical protein
MKYTVTEFNETIGFHDCEIIEFSVSKLESCWDIKLVVAKDSKKYNVKFGFIQNVMVFGMGNVVNEHQIDFFLEKDPHPEMKNDMKLVGDVKVYQWAFTSSSSGYVVSNNCIIIG